MRISDVARGEVLDSFDAEGGGTTDPSQPLEAIRQRTMGSLASLVDPRLSSWVRVASKPPSYEAYREFVTGQSIWGADHRQALTHFLRATELDSTFYAARVEAAILHRLLGECGARRRLRRSCFRCVIRLAPYEYHVLDGQVAQCQGDWQRAYAQARAVADLRPRSAFLEYSLALQAMQLGRYAEAKDLFEHHALRPGRRGGRTELRAGVCAGVVGAWRRDARHRRRAVGAGPVSQLRSGVGLQATLLARDGRIEEAERLD